MVFLFIHNAELLHKPQLIRYREQSVSLMKTGSSTLTCTSQKTSFLNYRDQSWQGIINVHRSPCKVSVTFVKYLLTKF